MELVDLITQHLPGFRDEAVYNGRQVFLYKRAQILVADVWAAYGRRTFPAPGTPSSATEVPPFAFCDIDRLTMFGASASPA